MDFDQEIQKRWEAFHKTLDPFPHSFQIENQEQLTVVTCKKVLHTVQSDFNAGLTTPLERARALNLMCFLHCQLNDRAQALELVQQALNEDGQNKNIVSLGNRAVILWFKNLCDSAEKQVKELECLRKDDEFEYLVVCAKAELAYTYSRLGASRYLTKAIDLFSKAIVKARESEVCLWMFGLALTERRALNQRSVPVLPNTSEDARRFGVLKLYLNSIERCRCDKLQAKIYVEMAHLMENQWGSKLQKQMEDEAKITCIEACHKAIQLDSDDPSVLWKSGKIFRHDRQLLKSYDLLTRCAKVKPTSTAFHHIGLTCIELAKDRKIRPLNGRAQGQSGTCKNVPTADTSDLCLFSSPGISSQTSSLDGCSQESTQGNSQRSITEICSEQSRPGKCNQQSGPDTRNQQSPSGIHCRPTCSQDQQREPDLYSQKSTPRNCSNNQQRDPKVLVEDLEVCGGGAVSTDPKQMVKCINPVKQENSDGCTSDNSDKTGRWEDSSSKAPVNSSGASIITQSSSGLMRTRHDTPVNIIGAQEAHVNSRNAAISSENAAVNSECRPVNSQALDNESAQPEAPRQRSCDADTPSRHDIEVFRKSCSTGQIMQFCETDDYVGEAIEALEKAVDISESQNAPAVIDLGRMYRAVGRLDEALNLFEKIISAPGFICRCFDKINAYEQAGLILKDKSRRNDCSEELRKQLVEESEGKLSIALQLCSRLVRRNRGLGPFIPHVIRSFSELLRSAKSSNRAPAEKNRMIARLFKLIENHKESLKVISQLLSQDRDQEKNPETLKIMIENFIGLGQYDAALQVIGVVRALDERPDRELFEDEHLFVRVNMQAGRKELCMAAGGDGFASSSTTSTITRPTTADSMRSRAGFYFSAAFREAADARVAEIEWEASSSEDSASSAGASDDEDESSDRWDVMVLHQGNAEQEARDIARALTQACGLKVTVNEDDCAAGSPIMKAILWVMARCRQVVVVLSTGGDRRGKSCKDSRSETSSGKKSGRVRNRRGRRSGAAVSATFGVLLQHAAKRCDTVVLTVEGEGGSPSGQAVPEILGPLRRRRCPPQLLRRGRSDVCGGGNDDVGNRGGGCGGGDVSAVGFVSDVNQGAGDGVSGVEGNNGSGFFGSGDDAVTERSFDDCVRGAVGGRVDPEASTVGSSRGSRHAVGNDGGEEVVNLSDPMVQQTIFDLFSFLVDVKFDQEL